MSAPNIPADPIEAAIERGSRTADLLNEHRDALFGHCAALLMITGSADGLRACAAGVVEAVIAAHERRAARAAQVAEAKP